MGGDGLVTVRMYTGFFGGEGKCTVNHISFFYSNLNQNGVHKSMWTFSDFQAHKYSVNSATWYINSEVVILPNGHAFELVLLT